MPLKLLRAEIDWKKVDVSGKGVLGTTASSGSDSAFGGRS
jgi:hypothetical protein